MHHGGWPARGHAYHLRNCFSVCTVNGANNVGGLIGEIYTYTYGYVYVDNIYFAGKLKSEGNVGSIIGNYNNSGGNVNVSNSYWVPETTGLTSSIYGTKVSFNNMFKQSTFENWDFSTIWTIDEGVTMPYLKNLTKPGSVN